LTYNDEDECSDYESPVVENPTWLDIAAMFNKAIHQTGDFHHCFLEGVFRTDDIQNGVPVYRFSTGR